MALGPALREALREEAPWGHKRSTVPVPTGKALLRQGLQFRKLLLLLIVWTTQQHGDAYQIHLTDADTEAQKRRVSCSESHSLGTGSLAADPPSMHTLHSHHPRGQPPATLHRQDPVAPLPDTQGGKGPEGGGGHGS